MIEIQHLKKAYENATPLKDVNTVIRQGDVIAVIGPSGTGKSTLLRCLNRLEAPTSGRVLVDGEDITSPDCNLNRIRRKLGMVFQSFNLYEHLTVVENCMLAQTVLLKKPRREAYEKAMELLTSVGMEKAALRYPDQLSGGQKQRAAIARTLSTDPEIVLFDEPTSALDPLNVGEVEDVIRDLAGRGRTMMIVTHSMEFARTVSNRVFYMDEGGIYEEGTPDEIFSHPKRERTRVFIHQLDCLRMEVVEKDHSLMEEMGKIMNFYSKKGLDAGRIMDACNTYEEVCSLMFRVILGPVRRMHVLAAYDEKQDKMTLSFEPESVSESARPEDIGPLTLEYKLISHYSTGLSEWLSRGDSGSPLTLLL